MQKRKTVSLVLGSGGARGLVHIGVIRWLEENGYEIKSISGCSIGALVGGFYAAGKLDIYATWLEELDIIGMLKLLDFKGSGGVVSGEVLMAKMEELIGDHPIEELEVKFTAVAADIYSEKEVWINEGSLLNAIRASISLPLFFTPYTYKGKTLVDGGVLNPVPIAPTFQDDTEMTIAVNLGGEPSIEELLPKSDKKSELSTKIQEYIQKIPLPSAMKTKNGMYDIADRSFESMQSTIARMKLSAYPPDIEIVVPRNLCATFEFNRAKEIIEYGYNLCSRTFSA